MVCVLLHSAERCLCQTVVQPNHTLHEEVEEKWERCAVNPVDATEGELRRQMAELGVAADRYGYATFDSAGQQVSRRVRAAVAHLHSAWAMSPMSA